MWLKSAPRWELTTFGLLLVSLLAILPLAGLVYYVLVVDSAQLINQPTSLSELWQQQDIGGLIFRTLLLGIVVACLNVAIGGWLAWLSQRYQFRGRKILTLLSLIPLAIPSYILAATLRDSLSPGGLLGEFFNLSSFTGFIPATIVLTIATLPYTQLLLTTHLTNTTHQQEEAAARLLGANSKQVFLYVTWPYLRPVLVLTWLITFLYAISDFGAVAVLNFPVLTWRLYQAVEYQQLILASLLGSSLLIISLPLFLFMRYLQGNKLKPANVQFPAFLAMPLPKKIMLLAFLIYGLIIAFGVVIPLNTLITWVMQGWQNQLVFAEVFEPIRATLLLSIVGATVITALAYLPGWIAARSTRSIDIYLEQMVYLTAGLPGILLGFGLLLVALAIAQLQQSVTFYHFILSSGILLIIGYALRFMPQAYAYLKYAFINLNELQYANARLLGATQRYWWMHLALPELWPSIRGAWIIVILAICKELPLTLLLGNSTGLQPLSVRMFDRYQEAFLHDAGISGLLLVIICLLLTLWTLRLKVYNSG